MSGTFDQLRAALAAGQRPIGGFDRTPRGGRRAAVLLLFTDEPDPRLTFIERAGSLRSHAGQVAFPGGGMDPGDATIDAAALREANEEVGLPRELVHVLGHLPTAWVPASNYDVTAVVARWDGSVALSAVDRAEVESVFDVPVSLLASPGTRLRGRHPSGYVGPAFVVDDWFIWGFTAHLLEWTLQLAGWEQPWDESVVVDVPERFLRD